MASFKEKKSKLRLVMPNMTNEKFINFQIKVLWDETIGIINHNTDACYLCDDFKIAYILISDVGPGVHTSKKACARCNNCAPLFWEIWCAFAYVSDVHPNKSGNRYYRSKK